jgi:hypothetical protein
MFRTFFVRHVNIQQYMKTYANILDMIL